MRLLTPLHRLELRSSLARYSSMAFQAAVSKLKSPVKELVASVVQEEGTLTGKVDNDQTEILNWIETVAQDDAVGEDKLKVKLSL